MSPGPHVPDDFQEDTANCAGNLDHLKRLKIGAVCCCGRLSGLYGARSLHPDVFSSQAVTAVADSCGKRQCDPYALSVMGTGIRASAHISPQHVTT